MRIENMAAVEEDGLEYNKSKSADDQENESCPSPNWDDENEESGLAQQNAQMETLKAMRLDASKTNSTKGGLSKSCYKVCSHINFDSQLQRICKTTCYCRFEKYGKDVKTMNAIQIHENDLRSKVGD